MPIQPLAPLNFVVVGPEQASPELSQTFAELITEGQRLLQAGDKPRALAYFTTATQLAPFDETAWLGRANAASEPEEIVECLEQVIALDPTNATAREQLIFMRLGKLQASARHKPSTNFDLQQSVLTQIAGSKLTRILLILFLLFFCGLGSLTLIAMVAFSNDVVDSEGLSNQIDLETATPDVFQLPATWTPQPTPTRTRSPTAIPTPSGKTKDALTVRAGPDPNFQRLGTLARDTMISILGKSLDDQYLAIEYPSAGKTAWIIASSVELYSSTVASLPVITVTPLSQTATRRPTAVPTAKATNTALTRMDFIVGRIVDMQTNCNRPWQILGTVYSSQTKSDRVNGVLVRIWAFDQLQGTVTSGNFSGGSLGYWEWNFAAGMEIIGKVAIVNGDGTLRSQPFDFHLTSKCDGAGAVNQIVLDFVGSP